MQFLKTMVRRFTRAAGFDITRYDPGHLGQDPLTDMRRLLAGTGISTIFDVGANVGQTAAKYCEAFPEARIHSFEPSPTTFGELKRRTEGMVNVSVWNMGVGAESGTLPFLENDQSDMSSFLSPGPKTWGQVVRKTDVPVITLDRFAEREKIDRISVLKSDTQGYDLNVFEGAEKLFAENRIDLVYYEVIVSPMYESQPDYFDVFRFLTERGFCLVSIYDQHYIDERLGWTDALFASKAKWSPPTS